MFVERRKELLKNIQEHYGIPGYVMLIANFENECCSFRQDGSFFYFTGVNEPGCIATISPEGVTTLYIPHFKDSRSKWLGSALDSLDHTVEDIDRIEYLGEPIAGYHLSATGDIAAYTHIISILQSIEKNKQSLYTLFPAHPHENQFQKILLWRLFKEVPTLEPYVHDISSLVASMRRKKSVHELEHLRRAIEITSDAHRAAAKAIRDGAKESDVHMQLESVMRAAGCVTAFPSIVASGSNSCVLHYNKNYCPLTAGDLVVVDIGARVNGYCADITRTYPVSGFFSERQREIYSIVLEAQRYVEQCARPGMWLSNKQEPEKSLYHRAVEFLKKQGYEKYFTHGIGHYLGLDVHDVGDYQQPLAPGDVITIEPGIYIPEESLGVRIEDDYLITQTGVECLSKELPK